MAVKVCDSLPEYTEIHWHELRIPNAMDGVALSNTGAYRRKLNLSLCLYPPDAGTYWYYRHYVTMAQMAQCLASVLVIEKPVNLGFAAD
ncbi:MAG: multicopper oxidase domain-containing protein [Paracoccaceae bacterium]|nr:multicopper oxidase domain-containing protein [Paracoccaceae bacterium]